jgi:hypothetical protein
MTKLGQTPSRTYNDDPAIITTVAKPERKRDQDKLKLDGLIQEKRI